MAGISPTLIDVRLHEILTLGDACASFLAESTEVPDHEQVTAKLNAHLDGIREVKAEIATAVAAQNRAARAARGAARAG